VRPLALLPIALLVAGAGLVAWAVALGEATVGIAVVVPFVTGGSWRFLTGVLLLVGGFLTLPFAWMSSDEEEPPGPAPAAAGAPGPSGGTGGLLLVGPVPIFFGAWRGVSRRARLGAAIAGGLVCVVVLLVALALFR